MLLKETLNLSLVPNVSVTKSISREKSYLKTRDILLLLDDEEVVVLVPGARGGPLVVGGLTHLLAATVEAAEAEAGRRQRGRRGRRHRRGTLQAAVKSCRARVHAEA